jgi:hypothetical protein
MVMKVIADGAYRSILPTTGGKDMKKTIWGGVVAVSVMGIGSEQTADAMWRNSWGGSCFPIPTATFFVSGTEFGNVGTSGGTLLCPLPEDAWLTKASVTALTFYGKDASTTASVQVAACVNYADASGAACDPAIYDGAASWTGQYALSPSHTCWSRSSSSPRDFAFAYMYVPPMDGYNVSTMRGFYAAN